VGVQLDQACWSVIVAPLARCGTDHIIMRDLASIILGVDVAMLANVFRRYPEVQAVYLFGSHAEGRARPDSDIDLALVTRDKSSHPNILDLLTDLATQGFSNVDLTFLDTDDVVLKHQAVRLNRVIYYTPDFDRGGTYSRIVREYLDFKRYLDVQREAYKQRILNAETRTHPQAIAEAG
jgi:hypothetical protein